MANEITITSRIQATKGFLVVDRNPGVRRATMNGSHMSDNVQSIPTSSAGTAITIGADVTTAGYSLLRNLDSTNYVEIGVQVGGTFYPLYRINPGDGLPGCLAINNPYARAHTAAVNLESCILES